ncbi:MAG: hypothetical protein CMA67_02795 [Euryarchaeota archaeon]|nr:hypothetical protein [Euryarchaeota archaeon]|tara:strand:- start:142 stop:378 length:237 start_codon:yes stop_codon:yes gene_type:complete
MVETLLLRNESKGTRYPIVLEKIIFVFGILGFAFVNDYVWSSIDLIWYQWMASVGLAIVVLILIEFIGRGIQSLRASK